MEPMEVAGENCNMSDVDIRSARTNKSCDDATPTAYAGPESQAFF
jgi:hypothetical protein